MNYEIENRVAVVTGSGKGIGRGIVLALARQGVKVTVNYNYNPATAEETMAMLKEINAQAICVKADVSTPEGAQFLIEETVKAFGSIDILVNNAALQRNLDLLYYDMTDFDLILRTNLGGYYNCISKALPYLKQSQNSRIINISSIHCELPTDFDPIYATSKGAIKMLTREAALEFGQYGINVNYIIPAGVQIEFKTQIERIVEKPSHHSHEHRKPLRNMKYRHTWYPIGRTGRPSDIAEAVCYLSSQAASHITGAGIEIDGGYHLV